MRLPVEEIQVMGATELRRRWGDPNEESFTREESLWEYWRRVADGAVPFSREEFSKALVSNNARISDVIGLLVRRNMLVSDLLQTASSQCVAVSAGDWLSGQLSARNMLNRLQAGDTPSMDEVCDALVKRGTSWAALEAVPILDSNTLQAVLNASEQKRIFTKRQRYEIRERAKSLESS